MGDVYMVNDGGGAAAAAAGTAADDDPNRPPTSMTASGRWGLGSLRKWASKSNLLGGGSNKATATQVIVKPDGPPGGKTPADYKRIFNQIDRLGKGSIEYGPFVALLHQLGLPHVTEQHARAFCSLIDLDNRNGLDLEEFSRIRAVFNGDFDFNATPFFAADFAAQHDDLGNVAEGDEMAAAKAEGGDQIKVLELPIPTEGAKSGHGHHHTHHHGHHGSHGHGVHHAPHASHGGHPPSALKKGNSQGNLHALTASMKTRGGNDGTMSLKLKAAGGDGTASMRLQATNGGVASFKGARGGGLNSFRMNSLRNLNGATGNEKTTPRTKMRQAPKSQSMFDLGAEDEDNGPETTRMYVELAQRALWRKRLSSFIEHPIVVWIIIVFLCIDVLRFFIDLLILEGLFGDNDDTDLAEDVLHYISITVLSIFLAETSCLLIALGRTFFRNPGYVLDFFVVPTSFILEVWFGGLGGFLVIARLWRMIRVFNVVADKNKQMMVSKLRALDKCIITVSNNFNRVARAFQHKTDAVIALRTELVWIQHPDPASPMGVTRRRRLQEVDGVVPPEGPKPFDLQALEVKNEVMCVFEKFDVRSEGKVTPTDLLTTLKLANIWISEATAALVIAMFDRSRNGYWEIGEFATIRDVLNGRWGMPDLLLDDTQFESTIIQMRKNVTHVRIEENEDPELHGQPSSTTKPHSTRARWRQRFAAFLQGDFVTKAIVTILFLDVLRFFLTLMILEDVFSSHPTEVINDMSDILSILSIVFLSIFSFELLCLLIALGCDFFKKCGYIFDLLIVPTCLVLELVASTKVTGFLIVARLWRIVNVLRKVANARQEKIARKEQETEVKLTKFQNNFYRIADRVQAKHIELQQVKAELFKARKNSAITTTSGLAPDMEAQIHANAAAMGMTANTKVTTTSSTVTQSNVMGRIGSDGKVIGSVSSGTSVRPVGGPSSGTSVTLPLTVAAPTTGADTTSAPVESNGGSNGTRPPSAPTSATRNIAMPGLPVPVTLAMSSTTTATSPNTGRKSNSASATPRYPTHGDDSSDDEPMPAAARLDDDDLPLPGTVASPVVSSPADPAPTRGGNGTQGTGSGNAGRDSSRRGSLLNHKRGTSASMIGNINSNVPSSAAPPASNGASGSLGGLRAARMSGKNQIPFGAIVSANPPPDRNTPSRAAAGIITIDTELPITRRS